MAEHSKLAIVLAEPQLGENIGAAARAMANFGLTDLRLVAPRDGWPNAKAEAMAAGADFVLEGAHVFDSVAQAISELHFVLAATARDRAAEYWDGGIVTTIEPLGPFYRAEEYHQDFFAKNPGQGYCLAVALPKVTKIRASYADYVTA